MPSENEPAQNPFGGIKVEYLNKKRSRLPKRSLTFDEYIDDWITERRAILHDIRENGERTKQGQLDELSMEMLERWSILQVGHSPTAWMERSTTATAMLQDFRSRRFGRRVHASENRERYFLDCSLSSLADSFESYKPLSPVEYQQALSALVFAREWLRYLDTHLVRPPGLPAPEYAAMPSFWSEPDCETKRVLAELEHCRPVGAFFTLGCHDQWVLHGGREECRKKLICPHCHSRNASRLVERVNDGPWAESRRNGRRIALVRLSVSTNELNLSRDRQSSDRESLGMKEWLRESTPFYDADPGDETRIRNIDYDQDLTTALTPYEVSTAQELQSQLLDICVQSGLSGGIRFHSIGPRFKKYLHELSVVGEVSERDLDRFSQAFGVARGPCPEIDGSPIECVVFPTGHASSSRIAIAGTSWTFDLDQIGAMQNPLARSRTIWRRRGPVGLRGAFAWQPLFLLPIVAFWSRWRVLRHIKFKSYHAFGTWKSLLPSDRNYKSTVQKARQVDNSKLTHSPVLRTQRRIKNSGLSQSLLAERAGVSKSAVSRFIRHGHGSEALRNRLNDAMNLGSSCENQRFPNAQSVKSWLSDISRNQQWLAEELGCSASKISRLLNGNSKWNAKFGTQVQELAVRLEAERSCREFTTPQSAQNSQDSMVTHLNGREGQTGTSLDSLDSSLQCTSRTGTQSPDVSNVVPVTFEFDISSRNSMP